jgi:hypothetical protein
MPTFTLERFVGVALVIVAFLILAMVLTGMTVGGSFWYLGCEGDIGGTNHTIEGKIWVYDSPLCTNIMSDPIKCSLSTYKNITRDNQNLSVCIWTDTSVKLANGKDVKCFFNGELSCADFSQLTSPRCQDVPDCQPVSAIKMAVERLKPGG